MANAKIKCIYCSSSHAKLNGICTRCEEKLKLIRIIQQMCEQAKADRAERLAREAEREREMTTI